MKLKFYQRAAGKKSDIQKMRREGDIPASVYVKGHNAESISIKSSEFSSLMRKVLPGRLSTAIFSLVDENGKERRVVVKDIQYHVTTYQVLHLDFEELIDNVMISIKVPIEYVGAAESPGVKLGGAVRQVIRSVKVRCLPKDIPAYFTLDVKDLGPRESKRLSDIAMPQTVRPLANLKEVALVIVKR